MMNVNRKLFVAITLMGCLNACKKDGEVNPNDELHTKLDGIYILKSAVADQAFDINMDGNTSNDMLLEIPRLKESKIDIVVNKSSKLYRVMWPEQHQVLADAPGSPQYAYALTGDFDRFDYNKEQGEISPDGSTPPVKNPTIQIQNNSEVKVKLIRTLYTETGQQKVVINAIYIKDTSYHTAYN